MINTVSKFPEARCFNFTSRWMDGSPACRRVDAGRPYGYEDRLLGKAPGGEWVKFIHRCFIDQGLRYDERLRRTPSVAFSLHLLRIAPTYYFPYLVRMMNRETISTTRPAKKDVRYYNELIQVHEVFFEQFGDDLMALSRAAYSRRMSALSRDCAHAGLAKDAYTYFRKAVATHPWDYKHIGTFLTYHFKNNSH